LNPILQEILRLSGDVLRDPSARVSIVVRGREISGTEAIVRESGLSDDILARVGVCSWTTLRRREVDLPDKTRHIVISPFWPSIEYSMHWSNAQKFTFIGGARTLERTRKIVKYRINEEMARPLWMISGHDDCPGLLKSIFDEMKSTDGLTNEIIQEYSEDTTLELGEIATCTQSGMDSIGTTTSLKAGSEAALLLDGAGKGMFIPSSRTLFVKQNDKLEEVELQDARSSVALKRAVVGKDILVNNQGLYVSIRPMFLRLMIRNGRNINFMAGAFRWRGFEELYADVTYWNRVLEESAKAISTREAVDLDVASRRLAERLSKLGLTAKEPEYIRTWWTDYEDVPIDNIAVKRLYSVEHPRGSKDVRQIFNDVKELLPDFKLDDVDAEKTYTAAVKMQNIRRAVFKRESSTFRYLKPLFVTMEKEITSIARQLPTFRVSSAYLVRIDSEVPAFRRLGKDELQELSRQGSFSII